MSAPESIIQILTNLRKKIRIHTIGIGVDCNKSMVKLIAQKGRGSCNLVADKSEDLNTKVITSLMQAFEPSLKACELTFFEETI